MSRFATSMNSQKCMLSPLNYPSDTELWPATLSWTWVYLSICLPYHMGKNSSFVTVKYRSSAPMRSVYTLQPRYEDWHTLVLGPHAEKFDARALKCYGGSLTQTGSQWAITYTLKAISFRSSLLLFGQTDKQHKQLFYIWTNVVGIHLQLLVCPHLQPTELIYLPHNDNIIRHHYNIQTWPYSRDIHCI